jgi:hypothetical protein
MINRRGVHHAIRSVLAAELAIEAANNIAAAKIFRIMGRPFRCRLLVKLAGLVGEVGLEPTKA